jgi:hypothetical protein
LADAGTSGPANHGDPKAELAKLLGSISIFPERAHLLGAYALGKAQRVMVPPIRATLGSVTENSKGIEWIGTKRRG